MRQERRWRSFHQREHEENPDKVMPIVTIVPEGINACAVNGEWEEIELSLDSGATKSVVPETMSSSAPTQPGSASRRGVQYEVGNGERIPNEVEKAKAEGQPMPQTIPSIPICHDSDSDMSLESHT